MKKSLVILTLILAAAATEMHATNGVKSGERVNHSDHSSSLDNTTVSNRSDLTAFTGYSTMLFDGNSPSSRKNSHWSRKRNSTEASAAPEEPVQKTVPVRPAHMRKWQRSKRRMKKQEEPGSTSPVYFTQGLRKAGLDSKCPETVASAVNRSNIQYTTANQELKQLVKWIAESGLY